MDGGVEGSPPLDRRMMLNIFMDYTYSKFLSCQPAACFFQKLNFNQGGNLESSVDLDQMALSVAS